MAGGEVPTGRAWAAWLAGAVPAAVAAGSCGRGLLTAWSESAIIAIIERGDRPMASITIRRLDDSVKKRLRLRAAQHGRSMEDEARRILRAALTGEEERGSDLAQAIRRRFEPLGGVELPLAPRQPMREPPDPLR